MKILLTTSKIYRSICGIYFEEDRNSLQQNVIKIYCFIVGFTLLSLWFIFEDLYEVFSTYDKAILSEMTIEYGLIVALSLMMKGESYDVFLSNPISCSVTLILATFLIIIRIITFMLYVLWNPIAGKYMTVPAYLNLLVFVPNIQLFLATRVYLFEVIWRRMKVIREVIQNKSLVMNVSVDTMRENIREGFQMYDDVIELVKQVHVTKLTLLIAMVSYFLKLWWFFKEVAIKNEFVYQYHNHRILNIIYWFLMIMLWGIFVSCTQREVAILKKAVQKKLALCTDNDKRKILEDAYSYFERNPFKYSVWVLFNVDMEMNLSLINFTAYFAVVVLQFSHVFD